MKTYNLIISSKSLKSLKTFLFFFNKAFEQNFSFLKKNIIKKNKKKVFAILKSPHVHKKAQEQFGIKLFSTQLTIKINNTRFRFLIFIKFIRTYLFPNINIICKNHLISNENNNFISKIFNSRKFIHINNILQKRRRKKNNNYYYFSKLNQKIKVKKRKSNNFIRIFEVYGISKKYHKNDSLKNLWCLGSSVGRAKD